MNEIKFAAFIILFSLMGLSCSADKRDDNKINITFWHSFVASTIPALNELIGKFEKENPGIRINAQYVPTGDALVQKLVTAVQSNTAPDVSWIHSDFISKLVDADAVYPVSHFINSSNGLTKEELDDIFPQLLQAASWRDTLYAIPMEATVLALLYNKDLFKKAGLDPDSPPGNWEELQVYARKLTVDANNDGIMEQYGFYVPAFPASGPLSIWMVLQWTPFLWQAGGEEINKEQTQVLFNSEAGVQALTLWRDIYRDVKFNNFSLSHDMGFSSGTIAMIMDGPWDLPQLKKMIKFKWGITSLPEGPVKKATYLAGEHLAIFRQSKHPEEAWEFVKWIISPENQAFFSEKSGYLPVRKSVLEMDTYNSYLEKDPFMKAFVGQMKIGYARGVIDYHRVEINHNIAEAVEKAIIGNMDPKAALDAAAEKSNRLLRDANRK
jgi:ABC-type glycerol-3-phosphate transport system substrate-binding protein